MVEGLIRLVLDEDDDEKLVLLEVSEDVFDRTSLNSNVWVDFSAANPSFDAGTHGDCLKACEGVSRPGLCKAGCWGELGVRVGVGDATFIKALKD